MVAPRRTVGLNSTPYLDQTTDVDPEFVARGASRGSATRSRCVLTGAVYSDHRHGVRDAEES